jgi:hypothetical protein
MTIHQQMDQLTYVVEHNPNCYKKFKVRLCGKHYRIDSKPDRESLDVIGYGDTFEEAAQEALKNRRR